MLQPRTPKSMLGHHYWNAIAAAKHHSCDSVRVAEMRVNQVRAEIRPQPIAQSTNPRVVHGGFQAMKSVPRWQQKTRVKDSDFVLFAHRLDFSETRVLGSLQERGTIGNRRDNRDIALPGELQTLALHPKS